MIVDARENQLGFVRGSHVLANDINDKIDLYEKGLSMVSPKRVVFIGSHDQSLSKRFQKVMFLRDGFEAFRNKYPFLCLQDNSE